MAANPRFIPALDNALEDDTPLPNSIEVEIPDEGLTLMDDETMEIDPETGEMETTSITAKLLPAVAFDANLADLIDEDELTEIGQKLVELVEADNDTRQGWYKRLKRGMEALGIYDQTGEDVSDKTLGVTRITHPLIMEAVTQFQSRAFAELYPSKGPVKSAIIGEDTTEEKFEQAQRVERFMNYQLTVEDRDYYDERDQMLFMLPLTGSEFDKQYYCPIEERVVSSWVRCDDFIVDSRARSLKKAPRLTHVLRYTEDEYEALVAAGTYREVELASGEEEENDVRTVIRKMDETEDPSTTDEDDEKHAFYEVHTRWELPDEIDSGASLPYIITVEAATGEVLSIRRNWKEGDSKKKSRLWFTHKKFLPGFGFYGFGLIHVIGSLGEAATQILNILLDSGAYASLQGGFKSKDAKLGGDIELTPGQWTDTEMTAEELSKAFYTPPFKEPSQVLNQLLGTLTTIGQRFASTTEVMTGTAGTSGPVGNIVAQIEQGSKVFSGIHRRLHKAIGDELIHIAELNGETLPDAYPFTYGGQNISVLRADFDDRIDILPVSDPNIFSAAQRLAMAQTAVQTLQQYPTLGGDLRTAVIDMLKAMHFPSPEKYFPKPAEAKRCDPVTEGALVMLGQPIKAFLEQDHAAHNQVHQLQLAQAQQSNNPAAVNTFSAHIQEHAAMLAYMQMQQAMVQQTQQQHAQHVAQVQQAVMAGQLDPMAAQQGLAQMQQMHAQSQPPAFDWNAKAAQTLPPEQENAIARQAAQAAQQLLQQMQPPQQAADPSIEVAKINSETTLKRAEIESATRKETAQIEAGGYAQAEQIKATVAAQNKQVDERIAALETAFKRYEVVMTDDRERDQTTAELLMERDIQRQAMERDREKEIAKAAIAAAAPKQGAPKRAS